MIKYEQPNFLRNPFAIVSKSCIDLVKMMLVKDPSQRITSEAALNHSFFNILGDLNVKGPPSVFPIVRPPRRLEEIKHSMEEKKGNQGGPLIPVPEIREEDS